MNGSDLKSRVLKGTYRFNSDPGHQLEPDPSAGLGISPAGLGRPAKRLNLIVAATLS